MYSQQRRIERTYNLVLTCGGLYPQLLGAAMGLSAQGWGQLNNVKLKKLINCGRVVPAAGT
jgi:hypothetical protein